MKSRGVLHVDGPRSWVVFYNYLLRVGRMRELLPTVKKRKVYLDDVLRHNRYRLLPLIIMGKVGGKRKVG